MKKYLLIALALLVFSSVSILSEEITIGEKEPCEDQINWTGPRYMVMKKGDCYYLIEYYIAVYSESRSYSQITGFYSLSDGTECDVYDSYREDAYPYIWLNDNDLQLYQYTEWVVEEAPCFEVQYKRDEDPIDLIIPSELVGALGILPSEINYTIRPNEDLVFSNIGYSLPCSGSDCCYMEYSPIMIGDSIVAWEYDENLFIPQPECNEPYKCEPSCDKLKFNYYGSGEGSGFKTDVKDNLINDLLYPNPSSNNFTFNINNSVQGKGVIIVYNINGKKVLVHNFDKNKGSLAKTINMSEFKSGNYYYIIKINSLVIKKGILSLIK